MERIALTVAAVVFLVVAIMHLLRVAFKVKVTFGNFQAPLWLSLIGCIFALSLSIFMFSSIR